MGIFFIYFIHSQLEKMSKFPSFFVLIIKKRLYICNRLPTLLQRELSGEILKRPTRADCKSAVQTSQVRILLSPLQKLNSLMIVGFFAFKALPIFIFEVSFFWARPFGPGCTLYLLLSGLFPN